MGCCSGKRGQYVDDTTDFFSDDYSDHSVSKLPSGRLPMNRKITHDHITSSECYHPNQLQEVVHVIQEIFSTEETYIAGLRNIYEIFLMPLWKYRAIGTKVLKKFDCVKNLLVFHTNFIQQLDQDFEAAGTPGRLSVWVHLKRLLDEMTPLYETYIHQYEEMIRTITYIRRKSKTINAHFNEAPYPIDAFIILPLQRITRYKLLFSKLRGHTPLNHPDFKHIEQIVDRFSVILDEINSQRERQLRLLEVGARLTNLNQPFSTHDRKLIAEHACFFAKGKQQPGFFVLCSDCLLLCREDWSVFVWINLKKIRTVKQLNDRLLIERRILQPCLGIEPLSSSRKLNVEDHYEEEPVLLIYAKSNEECSQWYKLFSSGTVDITVSPSAASFPIVEELSEPDLPEVTPQPQFSNFNTPKRHLDLAHASHLRHLSLEREFKRRVASLSVTREDSEKLPMLTPRGDGSFPLNPNSPPTVDEFGVGNLFDDDEAEDFSYTGFEDVSRPQSVRSVVSDVITPPKGAITPPTRGSRIIFVNGKKKKKTSNGSSKSRSRAYAMNNSPTPQAGRKGTHRRVVTAPANLLVHKRPSAGDIQDTFDMDDEFSEPASLSLENSMQLRSFALSPRKDTLQDLLQFEAEETKSDTMFSDLTEFDEVDSPFPDITSKYDFLFKAEHPHYSHVRSNTSSSFSEHQV